MEIKNVAQLEEYLEKVNSIYERLVPGRSISSITAHTNYVWRVVNPSAIPPVIVIKHAEIYTSQPPHLAIGTDHLDTEAAALIELRKDRFLIPRCWYGMTPRTPVTIPRVFNYDSINKVLMLVDGGSSNLKQLYAGLPSSKIQGYARDFGHWLCTMHQRTHETVVQSCGSATSFHRYPYTQLSESLGNYGLDAFPNNSEASFGRWIEHYVNQWEQDNSCVCHGDCRPANVLVKDYSGGISQLTLVDWHKVRRGNGAIDVAKFATEAYLLDRFCGGKGMRAAFLDGYRSRLGPTTYDFMCRVAAYMGSWLVVWPQTETWLSDEGKAEVVMTGYGLLRKLVDGFDWRQNSHLVEELRGLSTS